MFLKCSIFAALASSAFGVPLGEADFQASPTDNSSNPAAPWATVEASGDVNPIYVWSSDGGIPSGEKVALFKDGNGTAMPDYLSQNLTNVTADALDAVTVSVKAGWRGAVAADTATFRVVLWNATEGAALASAEFSITRTAALSNTWTVDGNSPFTVSLPYDRTAANLVGDALALRIGRVDADSGLGSNKWQSSAWIDDIAISATVIPPPLPPAVAELLARRVPALVGQIEFEALPAASGDTFDIGHAAGKVVIAGTNTNARAAGLHWYLKHHCGMHFSWSGDQLAVPSPLPLPDDPDGDADGDGIENLSEFLFGTDPELPGPAITIQPAGTGLVRVQWKRRSAALLEAIDHSLQQSPDLAAWSPWTGAETTAISSLSGYLDVQIEVPSATASSFFRAVALSR